MSTVKYIVHYDINNNEGRNFALSAVNKVNYIIEVLNKSGYDVDILSASVTSSKGYFKGTKMQLSDGVRLIKMPAIKSGGLIRAIPAVLWRNAALLFLLLKNIKRNEQVIVYHSLGSMRSLRWAKRIRGFKTILEVEEIYNDVIKKSVKDRKKEIKFLKTADKYIFPTELLNEYINKDKKPYAIIHGTYRTEQDRGEHFNDGKIHVLYAGTLDPRKGGAAAAAAAGFLPENYHVHILGFGSKTEIENIKRVIAETRKKAKAAVTYDGLLSGEDYIRFIQKCHIGLSTQNPDADFNATSFPSKILSYMANGLRVVSVRIPAIERSSVGKYMYYYQEQKSEEIAKAILNVDMADEYDGRKIVSDLDMKFVNSMNELLDK